MCQDCQEYIKSEPPHTPHHHSHHHNHNHKDEFNSTPDFSAKCSFVPPGGGPDDFTNLDFPAADSRLAAAEFFPNHQHPHHPAHLQAHQEDLTDPQRAEAFGQVVKDDFVSLVNDSVGYCYDNNVGGHLPPPPPPEAAGDPSQHDIYTYTINYTHTYRPDVIVGGGGGDFNGGGGGGGPLASSSRTDLGGGSRRATPPPPYSNCFSSPSPSSSTSSHSPKELSTKTVKYTR